MLLEEALSRRCCFADKDDALGNMQDIAADEVAEEKRTRVLVISNLPESEGALASKRQQSDESKVESLLDALDVQCRPLAVYRVGRPTAPIPGGNKRSRFTFVELPHKSIATECLKRKQRLRKCSRFHGHDFSQVYVERSMSKHEQERAYRERMQRRSAQQDQAYHERVQRRTTEKPDSSDAPPPRTPRWDVQPEHSGNSKNVGGTVPPSG